MAESAFRTPRAGDEKDQARRSAIIAFAGGQPEGWEWYDTELMGEDDQRVLIEDGVVVGGVSYYRFGHYLGGRAVPTQGIAAVSVPPEHRGTGAATRLMEAAVREGREEGHAVSTLYASSAALYRRSGYEMAGTIVRYEIPTRALRVPGSRDVRVRRGTDADRPAIRELYDRLAPATDGFVAREEKMWKRVFEHPLRQGEVAVVERGGSIEGYVVYKLQGELMSPDAKALVLDCQFGTAEAGRAIIRLLAGFGTMHPTVAMLSPVATPLQLLLPDNQQRCVMAEHWMLRVLDVAKAIEARGYAPGLTAEVTLGVRDELLTENAGVYTVRVADGRARVERGGDAASAVSVDVRGLAAMYTGFMSPVLLRQVDMATGPADALALAGAVFSGSPGMGEMF